jgi:RNA polymerase sigma factor (sigma-70 family)
LASAESVLSVYLENRDELVRLAKRIVNDGPSAEDVVQEAWIRFSRTENAEIAQPKHYLFTIVRNLAFDWLRRSSVVPTSPTAQAYMEAVASEAPSAERVLYYRDELRELHAVLAELPERTQRAFRLSRIERRTLQETADQLGVSLTMAHKIVTQASVYLAQRIYGDKLK